MDDLANILRWNEDSFRVLYKDYYKALVVYAMRFTNDQAVSEDCVQDMFSKLYERRPDFSNVYTLRAYLYNTVRNLCVDHLRHKKVETSYLQSILISSPEYAVKEDGEDEIFTEEFYRRLADFFNTLPPRQHEIMLMAMEGKKNHEIAELLGVKSGTVKTQKLRAIQTMRNNFDVESCILLATVFNMV